MKRLLCLFGFLFLPATCFAADDLFDIRPVADGVYADMKVPRLERRPVIRQNVVRTVTQVADDKLRLPN